MPPSRFTQVSRYRNVVISSAKSHERFSELGLAPLPDNASGRSLVVTPVSEHVFARSSASPNTLIVLPSTAVRKYAKQPPALSGTSQGTLADFDVAKFQTQDDQIILAAGSLNGTLSLRTVTLPANVSEDGLVDMPSQLEGSTTNVQAGKDALTSVHFHPMCSSLLATASNQACTVQVRDIRSDSEAPVREWQASQPLWDISWSTDGSQLATAAKDTTVSLWDAREAGNVLSVQAHSSKIKPAKVSFISGAASHLFLTTGFSQMRQREIAIWDQRSPASPLKRNTLDVASSGLDPICDSDRGIVYLTSKGDSSIRWIDVGSQDQGGLFAEGIFPLDVSTSSAALAPALRNDTSVGEIARLYVSTSGSGAANSSDSIVPYSVRVPRRNYIDFHSDIYPETPQRNFQTAVEVDAWVKGEQGYLPLLSLDPALRSQSTLPSSQQSNQEIAHHKKEDVQEADTPQAHKSKVQAKSTHVRAVERPVQSEPVSSLSSAPVATPQAEKEKTVEKDPPARVSPSPHSEELTSLSAPLRRENGLTTTAQQSVRSSWSRKPLAGTTPLIAAYQNLANLDLSRGPDARMLAVSRRFLFLPLAGPGGRLGVHPLETHGRLPVHIPSFVHGTPLLDFAVNPFDDDQVITITSDNTIRVWKVPEAQMIEEKWCLPPHLAEAPISTVTLPGSTKVAEIVPHPYVRGLVVAIPSDADGQLHLVDVERQRVVCSKDVPGNGMFAAAWSPDGSVLATTSRDRHVYVLDVRMAAQALRPLGKAKAHDSPRSSRPVWLDGHHILTVGHTVGSIRQLKLYRIQSSAAELEEIAKYNLDSSPSLLFPVWDSDTNVLWLWSKGERIVSAFEIQPGRTEEQNKGQDTFTLLPAFQHGQPQLGLAFLPKDCVDVRNVEIATALRLCKTELQHVAWNIPRSRPEFFQDDVYPPTVSVKQPLLDVPAYMAGHDPSKLPTFSLKPDGMIALSQAPPAQTRVSSLSKGPTVRAMTEKEREEEALSNVFAKAKGRNEDKDPNHNEEQAARAPDDDDWDSD